MTRISELVALCALLVDRSRNENVDLALFQILNGSLQCRYRRCTCRRRSLADLDGDLRGAAVDDVDLAAACLRSRLNRVIDEPLHIAQSILIICRHFGRAVDHGGAHFGHTAVSKGLDDDLPADTVGVALRDSYSYFVITHCVFWCTYQLTKVAIFIQFAIQKRQFGAIFIKIGKIAARERKKICFLANNWKKLVSLFT